MDPKCAPMLSGCQKVLPTKQQRDEKPAVTAVTASLSRCEAVLGRKWQATASLFMEKKKKSLPPFESNIYSIIHVAYSARDLIRLTSTFCCCLVCECKVNGFER